MTHALRSAALAATALIGVGFAGQARAQEEEKPFVTFTGAATFVTDYRFRGVSLSNTDIAVQPTITATTKPGFFVSIWGSSIARYGDVFDDDGFLIDPGATTEIDIYGGWTGTFGPVTPTIGIYGYLYPGGTGVDYYEIYGSLGFTLGPVAATVGVNYAPSQTSIGGGDNTYVYFSPSFGIPGVPITIKGTVGYETGSIVSAALLPIFSDENDKVDWMIGADFKYKFLTFGVQYIGNNRSGLASFNESNLGDTVVGVLSASF